MDNQKPYHQTEELSKEAISLLKKLISIPSLSKEEDKVCEEIHHFFSARNIKCHRKQNNIWVKNKYFDENKPVVLLNSHIDTVRPSESWTRKPFEPTTEGNKLFGLGSNDAGGPLVSLLTAFLYFYDRETLSHNLIFAATAEEEISGKNGISSILDELGNIELAIVGEPTRMQMALAEKGLMVIDATARGESGHAARDEGINAIYQAIEDIQWIQGHHFPEVSPYLGEVKMTVTLIEAGTQHNVVPDTCQFVIDVRTNEHYSNRQVFEVINENTKSLLKARSFRLNPSGIRDDHPIVTCARQLNMSCFGSQTTSDQALMPFDSVKIGPGDSSRSHTADEYIYMEEIEDGITKYIQLLEKLTL